MNRRKQLWVLIGLSALSACALYVIQGALATGADASEFPQWFWVLDYCLWGARALIEAAVIMYLFTTRPQTKADSIILGVLEFSLVALITLTVGPALRAVGLGVPVRDSLAPALYSAWTFGIAAYTSLMMGAAGYAYRVQSDEHDSADVAEMRAENERLQKAVGAWSLLTATDRAAVIALCTNGDKPGADVLAEAMKVSAATVRRGYKIATDQ